MTNSKPTHELLAATLEIVVRKYSTKTVAMLGTKFERERDNIADGVRQAAEVRHG